MIVRSRIINVKRKPQKCPLCGNPVMDIIYGTGDMTEADFILEFRKDAIMGGDKIPDRPPIWACSCGCRRFRKVNADGTDAPVKPKLLKNVRKRSLSTIIFETERAVEALKMGRQEQVQHYLVRFVTEFGEKDTLSIYAVDELDVKEETEMLIMRGGLGLKGIRCEVLDVTTVPDRAQRSDRDDTRRALVSQVQ